MKKITLLFSFLFFTFNSFSQGSQQNKINWISLETTQEYSKKFNQNILLFFYKPNCEYCDKMKKETISDPEVVNLINSNFLPVKINGYTKDTIIFNEKIFGNQQPVNDGNNWRHDFYFEYARHKNGVITPTFVVFNPKLEKVIQFTGYQPKIQFLRGIKQFTK